MAPATKQGEEEGCLPSVAVNRSGRGDESCANRGSAEVEDESHKNQLTILATSFA